MRVAYVNTYFQSNHTGGGHVHMGQFVRNAVALGHEIWAYPNNSYPDVQTIPTSRLHHIQTMRQMDALYVRIERKSPGITTWSLPPRRWLYRFPVVVWEFNTVPDEALLESHKKPQAGNLLRHNGRGCDLAICVTRALAEIVRERIGLQHVVVVPNGSDPELFCPDVPVVSRMLAFRGKLNVVWIGSAKEAWHDFGMLKEAAELLWKSESRDQLVFHIIGPDLTGIMSDMPSNVFYWGAEYYNRLPNWLVGMDVGLSLYRPSPASYGSPLKVFDYLASGLTIISTLHPVVNELLAELGQPDLEVPFGEPKLLADILIRLAGDRKRVRQIGQAGRELVVKHYNWRRAVQDTMNEMEAILQERKKTNH